MMAYQNDGNGEANQLKVSNDFSDDNPLNGSNRTSTEFDESHFSVTMGRNKKKKRNKKSKKNVDSITRLKAETIRQNVANSSSKTRVKGDLHDKESEPTILIAPDDYVNLFSVKKETSAGSLQKLKPPKPKTDVDMAAANEYRNLFTVQKDSKTNVKTVNQFKIPSDAPTALIAPDDYQNLFTIAKANKESSVKVVNRTDHKAEATPKKMDPLTLKIPSDAPTALIAPEDYQNLFTKQTSSKTKVVTKNLPNVLSDAPTALIAPDDYQNLFTVQKVPKHKIPDKDLNLIKSATPTALIAPEDYQNLFTTQKNSKTKVVEAEKITNILSDSPTALIAPDDYQNLFTTQKPSKPKLVEMAMPKIPSDSPTALIAPDDYQNLFSNLKNNIKYIPEKSASKNENNNLKRTETKTKIKMNPNI
ncbi:hypothetical protein BLOT_005929 [Blomia tropicalis]|nr:hypothetical protein BLOT_005929 [Blomia tropicalis]